MSLFFFLKFYLLTTLIAAGVSFTFDKSYFGTIYQPYVKQSLYYGEDIPSMKSYVLENVKSMLALVSTKFANVIVDDQFAFHDHYTHNSTYYKGSYISVHAGEVAALINQKNGSKLLTLLYNIIPSFESANITKTGVQLALEAAEKANKIYPGTISGISLGYPKNLLELEQVLEYIKLHKKKAALLNITLGLILNCFDLINPEDDPFYDTQRQIIMKAEFVICAVKEGEASIFDESGAVAAAAFENIAKHLLIFQHFIHQINPKIETIGWTEWSSSSVEKWETMENLRIFWETASKWAETHRYKLYIQGAFDNPWRKEPPDLAHLGWWKLKDNEKINLAEGYVEKISEFSKPGCTEPSEYCTEFNVSFVT